jgi:hypothetical protein
MVTIVKASFSSAGVNTGCVLKRFNIPVDSVSDFRHVIFAFCSNKTDRQDKTKTEILLKLAIQWV